MAKISISLRSCSFETNANAQHKEPAARNCFGGCKIQILL